MMIDENRIEEYKARLCDRYTAPELVDLLDLPTIEIVEMFLDRIINDAYLIEEVGFATEEMESD